MNIYYVDKNPTEKGDHMVHALGCLHMPEERDKRYLGSFPNCFDALREAEKYYFKTNGCVFCMKECSVGDL